MNGTQFNGSNLSVALYYETAGEGDRAWRERLVNADGAGQHDAPDCTETSVAKAARADYIRPRFGFRSRGRMGRETRGEEMEAR